MDRETAKKLVRMGLGWIPLPRLRVLLRAMDADEPINFDGAVLHASGEYG